jgi:hypothetical protein
VESGGPPADDSSEQQGDKKPPQQGGDAPPEDHAPEASEQQEQPNEKPPEPLIAEDVVAEAAKQLSTAIAGKSQGQTDETPPHSPNEAGETGNAEQSTTTEDMTIAASDREQGDTAESITGGSKPEEQPGDVAEALNSGEPELGEVEELEPAPLGEVDEPTAQTEQAAVEPVPLGGVVSGAARRGRS